MQGCRPRRRGSGSCSKSTIGVRAGLLPAVAPTRYPVVACRACPLCPTALLPPREALPGSSQAGPPRPPRGRASWQGAPWPHGAAPVGSIGPLPSPTSAAAPWRNCVLVCVQRQILRSTDLTAFYKTAPRAAQRPRPVLAWPRLQRALPPPPRCYAKHIVVAHFSAVRCNAGAVPLALWCSPIKRGNGRLHWPGEELLQPLLPNAAAACVVVGLGRRENSVSLRPSEHPRFFRDPSHARESFPSRGVACYRVRGGRPTYRQAQWLRTYGPQGDL